MGGRVVIADMLRVEKASQDDPGRFAHAGQRLRASAPKSNRLSEVSTTSGIARTRGCMAADRGCARVGRFQAVGFD